tara:strand:- start:201 stop:428 length:228 start_codon:yes stop_codon:yes gene_type:complete
MNKPQFDTVAFFIMIELILPAIALALIIEGLIPALFPNKWKAYVKKLAEEDSRSIRQIGITITVFGAILLYFSIV